MSSSAQELQEGMSVALHQVKDAKLQAPQQHFRFTDLPKEIRCLVYEYYFGRFPNWGSDIFPGDSNVELHKGIFYTTRAIRYEALGYYLGTVKVQLHVDQLTDEIRASSIFACLRVVSLSRLSIDDVFPAVSSDYHPVAKGLWDALSAHPRIRYIAMDRIGDSYTYELLLWIIQKITRFCVTSGNRQFDFEVCVALKRDLRDHSDFSLRNYTYLSATDVLNGQKPITDWDVWIDRFRNGGSDDEYRTEFHTDREDVVRALPASLKYFRIHGRDPFIIGRSQFQALMEFTLDGWCFEVQVQHIKTRDYYRLKWVKDGELGKISPPVKVPWALFFGIPRLAHKYIMNAKKGYGVTETDSASTESIDDISVQEWLSLRGQG